MFFKGYWGFIQVLGLLIVLALLSSPALADQDIYAPVSPKKGWGQFNEGAVKEPEPSWGRKIALWIPNRVLDLVDIVKIDAGVGSSRGGVLRATSYAQAGYRNMGSLGTARVGLMGRRPPVMLEEENESYSSDGFQPSDQRIICDGEIGVGLDLFVAGYGGVCLDEAVDFVTGLVFVDLKNDDLR